MNYIKDMIIEKENGTVTFFLQTEGETDFWYWTVALADVTTNNYLEFVNDERNASLGYSVASFTTLEDAKADYFSL